MRRFSFASLLAAGALLTVVSCSDDSQTTDGRNNIMATGGAGNAGTPGSGGGAGAGTAGTSDPGMGGMSQGGAAGSGGSSTMTAGNGGGGGTLPNLDGGNPGMEGGVLPVAKGMSAGCGKPPPAVDRAGTYVGHNIMVTGVTTTKVATTGGSWTDRIYYLDLPTGYDPAKPYPLIFGGGGCGGQLITNGSNGGFPVLPANNSQAIQIGLSYVWAQGAGACFTQGGADTPDLPYFDSIMREVDANYCFDRGKVFVGGYSSGGWEAYMLGFARGGSVIRGISTAAGGLSSSRPPGSNLPFAALLLTGENDTANPATGPTGSDAARDLILQINGCVGTDTTPWPTCVGCGCVKYNGCPEAYPVIRCLPPGQGHTDGGGAYKTAIWSVWSTLP
jgi:poly(3-hydroxybutyrate) depolymerase